MSLARSGAASSKAQSQGHLRLNALLPAFENLGEVIQHGVLLSGKGELLRSLRWAMRRYPLFRKRACRWLWPASQSWPELRTVQERREQLRSRSLRSATRPRNQCRVLSSSLTRIRPCIAFWVMFLVPTRELALQTSSVAKEIGKHMNVQCMLSTGGTGYPKSWSRPCQKVCNLKQCHHGCHGWGCQAPVPRVPAPQDRQISNLHIVHDNRGLQESSRGRCT